MGDNSLNWSHVIATACGTSHEVANTRGQDFGIATQVQMQDQAAFTIAIADGAGSAEYGRQGSRLACIRTVKALRELLRTKATLLEASKEEYIAIWLRTAEQIHTFASNRGHSTRDYATTLLLVLITQNTSVFMQLGDGAIVVKKDDRYGVVFLPDNSEYANATRFITDGDFLNHLNVLEYSGSPPAAIAVFTDGLQRLGLNMATMAPHGPFFEPMFNRLQVQTAGFSAALSDQLKQFLQSEAVNARTDDDKTLCLAVRVGTKFD